MTRKRREGVAHCAKCGTTHTNVSFHEDGTLVTPADRPDLVRDILAAYASIGGHASSGTTMDMISARPAPRPGHDPRVIDRRTRDGRAWAERIVVVMGLEVELCDSGLMCVVNEPCGPDGEYPWGMAITDAGRAWLAEHPEGPASGNC